MQSVSFFKNTMRFLFLIFLLNSIGYLASEYMTPETIKWYKGLPHSSLTPSQTIFAPVWSVLFLLQAISALLVWGKITPRFFALQLGLNMLWSFSFFYLKNPTLALCVIFLFIWAIFMNIKTFGSVQQLSGWLILPTLVWSIFALYLNTVIVFGL